MYKPWVNAEEYMKAEKQKKLYSYPNLHKEEDDIFYREILIQEITAAMNALRENYPEVVMKMYVNGEDTMEDEHGNLYIDGLNQSFVFE